ncbi:hypothetical protein J6590_029594 [Homalodisca vitripennis]|nr:hypothetical protein J6590_029594 [Homalodisca vitripennis]
MERRRMQWMGHVKRMGDNRMPRIALEKEERGRRPRGRWEDQVWKDIERRGLQKMQVEEEETWNDRQKWRRLCTTTRDNGNPCLSIYGSGNFKLPIKDMFKLLELAVCPILDPTIGSTVMNFYIERFSGSSHVTHGRLDQINL